MNEEKKVYLYERNLGYGEIDTLAVYSTKEKAIEELKKEWEEDQYDAWNYYEIRVVIMDKEIKYNDIEIITLETLGYEIKR